MSHVSDLASTGLPIGGVAALDVGGLLHPDLGSTVGVLVFAAAVVVAIALTAGLALTARVLFIRLFRAEPPSVEPVWLRTALDLTVAPIESRSSRHRSTWLRQPTRNVDLPTQSERHTS